MIKNHTQDQHFLTDKKILKEIIKVSALKKSDLVLEIGPGRGILTRELAKKAKVTAVEIDEKLKPYLEDIPAEIIYDNALIKIDKVKFNKIVSNIPYSISEPLIKKLTKIDFNLAVLLTGKKFYEALTDEDSKLYYLNKIFFDTKKIMDVPKESFEPVPRVNSTLILIKKRKSRLLNKDKIIKELILQDDKKLKNALINSFIRVYDLTKFEAKQKTYSLRIPIMLFEKNTDNLSNEEFKKIIKEIEKLT
ncbi:MAG: rRNA adenine N-6-methyltransferase family protein [Candidatus Nanoarchaeia archaeon]|nr:rRNA adenine N-6-methyltransferase family protein [Candidatus Nanoarchaeia archaeon]